MSEERVPIEPQGHRVVETHFIRSAFPGAGAIRPLTREEAQTLARRFLESSRGSSEIERALREHSLIPMVSRAVGFAPYSRNLNRSKGLVIVPCTPINPDSTIVGGIGLSEGEPASGVVVHLQKMQVVGFTTYDMMGGKLVPREFTTKQLVAQGHRAFTETEYPREKEPRDLTIDTSASIATDAYKVLLFDEQSTMVHSATDLRALAHNTPIVSAIAELQYTRLEGLTSSPGTSCCSCCCCCWGSCSSCSAVSTRYVKSGYRIPEHS